MRSHTEAGLGFAVAGVMALCGCNTNPWDKTGPSITAPTISAVSPSIGSTEGGTYVTVDGDQLKPGFTATLDGVPLTITPHTNGKVFKSFSFTAPAHAAGRADLAVRDSDGQFSPEYGVKKYTWASPDTFDFNGGWNAFVPNGNPNPFTFTVECDVLLEVTCYDGTPLLLPAPVRPSHGQIAVSSNGIVVFSAKLLSNGQAVGTVDFGTCQSANWTGRKDGDQSTLRTR